MRKIAQKSKKVKCVQNKCIQMYTHVYLNLKRIHKIKYIHHLNCMHKIYITYAKCAQNVQDVRADYFTHEGLTSVVSES